MTRQRPLKIPEYGPLTRQFFGHRLSMEGWDFETMQLYGTLYESVRVTCRFDPVTGRFQMGTLQATGTDPAWDPQGRVFEGAADRESILAVFGRVDEYVRLLLPDEYLDRFGDSYGSGPANGDRLGADVGTPLTLEEMYDYVAEFFGPRLSLQTWKRDFDTYTIEGILYEAFAFRCILDFDEQRGGRDLSRALSGPDILPSPYSDWILQPFGYKGEGTFGNGDKFLRYWLERIDEHARLHLPVKYLTAFNHTHGITTPDQEGTR